MAVVAIQNQSKIVGTPLNEGKGIFDIIKPEIMIVETIITQGCVFGKITKQAMTIPAKGLGNPVKYGV